MDKFGIFNILSALKSLSKAGGDGKITESTENTNDLKSPEPQNSGINPEPVKTENRQIKNAPLQAKMLAVMKSHDEIVKRVNEKNSKG